MVVAAEQDGVVEVGGAAVGPVVDVVGVAPARWSVAAGEGAAAVAQHEGASERAGDEAALSADVEDLAGAAEDGGEDGGVAGEAAHRVRGEVEAGVEGAGAELPGQLVVAGGDDDLGGVAAVSGSSPVRRASRQTSARASWRRWPGERGVVGAGRGGQWVDGGAEQAGGFGVEGAGESQSAVGAARTG